MARGRPLKYRRRSYRFWKTSCRSARLRQATGIDPGGVANRGAAAQQPQFGRQPVGSQFAFVALERGRVGDVDVLHEGVQEFMNTGIERHERRLIGMRVGQSDQGQVLPFVQHRGDPGQAASAVPVHGDVIGQDQVETATPEAEKDRPVACPAADLAGAVAGLELDAAAPELADRLRPDSIPEAADLAGRAAGAEAVTRLISTTAAAVAPAAAAVHRRLRRVTALIIWDPQGGAGFGRLRRSGKRYPE